MKLKIGPTRRFRADNTRGAAFHGMGAFVGTGRLQRAHVYSAAALPVGPDDYKKIDPMKLAGELEVDMCVVNRGRFWMMDELEVAAGDTVDFHGVAMNWVGDMTGAEMVAQFENAYLPCLIRRDTIWTWYAGKPVYLLREPGTNWVLQEYTKAVDASLTPDNLHELGGKLKNLPKGWTFETKVLTKDLTLDTGRAGGWAAIIRDDLHCTYQACGQLDAMRKEGTQAPQLVDVRSDDEWRAGHIPARRRAGHPSSARGSPRCASIGRVRSSRCAAPAAAARSRCVCCSDTVLQTSSNCRAACGLGRRQGGLSRLRLARLHEDRPMTVNPFALQAFGPGSRT